VPWLRQGIEPTTANKTPNENSELEISSSVNVYLRWEVHSERWDATRRVLLASDVPPGQRLVRQGYDKVQCLESARPWPYSPHWRWQWRRRCVDTTECRARRLGDLTPVERHGQSVPPSTATDIIYCLLTLLVVCLSPSIHMTLSHACNPLTPTVAITGTAIKHPVSDRVKPSFVIFDIRALWRSALSVRVPRCQKLQMTVWHRMFYTCTHMVTIGVKGLIGMMRRTERNDAWLTEPKVENWKCLKR